MVLKSDSNNTVDIKKPHGDSFASNLLGSLTEELNVELHPYLPKEELIGGSVPHIPGTEDETVWNAASQACGTERVHYCYTIDENRCWYLATPSSALASNPDSWCPLAAALPGNSEYWDKDTVYLYEQEGSASALRWDKETGRMQVYLGAARTVLPRLQSMEANFVTVDAGKATAVKWKNRALNREKLSRMLIKVMFFLASAITGVSILVWIVIYMYSNSIVPQLEEAREASLKATNQLMIEAVNAYQTNTDRHLSRVIELLHTTGGFGGVLTRYELKKNKVEWNALLPNAVKPGQLKAKAIGVEGDRVMVQGNR